MSERVVLPAWASDAVARLDVDALADRIVAGSMRDAFGDHGDDRHLEQVLSSSVRENTAGLRSYLAGQIALGQVTPVRPVALAALQAQLEISESAIQRAYRVGARVVLGAWVAAVRDAVATEAVAPLDALEAVSLVVASFFDYQDHVVKEVAAAHAAEQEKLRQSKVQMRRQVLRSHLRGESMLSEDELAEALQYPVGESHLAIVLPASPEHEAKRIATALRVALSASASLIHPLGLGMTAVWVSKPGRWTERVSAALSCLRESGVLASAGTVRAGGDGLRLSFEEARSVETVRAAWGDEAPDVIDFPEVKLEVLALADPDATRRFVEEELGGLADSGKTAAQLRETLLLWFAAGSHVSAAARLQLHEHTIRNRLRRAEELVGHPLTMRRTEMQVALRLHRVVGSRPRESAGGSLLDQEAAALSGRV